MPVIKFPRIVQQIGLLSISSVIIACSSTSASSQSQSYANQPNNYHSVSHIKELPIKTMSVNGKQRQFRVYDPGGNGTRPVVIALHGGGGSSATMNKSGLLEKAKSEGFIVVFPDGTPPTGRKFDRMQKVASRKGVTLELRTWNASKCCANAMVEGVDDVLFLNQLIDTITNHHNADRSRIYLVGLSNGAMLINRYAAEWGHKIAAMGLVVGGIFPDQPKAKTEVPVIMINALHDDALPNKGGVSPNPIIAKSQRSPFLSTEDNKQYWVKANSCQTNAVNRILQATVVREQYLQCKNGAHVNMILLEEGGHGWPGAKERKGSANSRMADMMSQRAGGRTGASDAINATDELWSFLKQYSRN